MSMTKKQARKFKACLEQGEWPPLPRGIVAEVLCMKPAEIVESVHHARAHDYGTGCLYPARRLVQMGLFDEHWNLTNYGDSYVHALEESRKAQEEEQARELARVLGLRISLEFGGSAYNQLG